MSEQKEVIQWNPFDRWEDSTHPKEVDEPYLVTMSDGFDFWVKIDVWKQGVGYFEEDKWWDDERMKYGDDCYVIAWAELPKPYKGKAGKK